jgi:hypothetical protein
MLAMIQYQNAITAAMPPQAMIMRMSSSNMCFSLSSQIELSATCHGPAADSVTSLPRP